MNLSTPKWHCTHHQRQIITNFCLSQQCLVPLCPQCLKSHQQYHCQSNTYAQFDDIENVFQSTKIQLIQKEEKAENIKKVIEMFLKNKPHELNQIITSLRQFKDQCISTINQKFITLEEEIQKNITQEHQTYKLQFQSILSLVNHIIQQAKHNLAILPTNQGLQAIQISLNQLQKKQLSINTSLQQLKKSMVKYQAVIDRNCINRVIQNIGQSIQINTIQIGNCQLVDTIIQSRQKQISHSCLNTLNLTLNPQPSKTEVIIQKLSNTTQKLQNELNTLRINKFEVY